MSPVQTDIKRRQDFKAYYDKLGTEWSFIDEAVKDSIFQKITRQAGERLEEFIDTFKILVTYTDKTNDNLRSLHYPDRRVNKHPKIKKGMSVSLIIQPKYNQYKYVMSLYFTYKKVIYDLEIEELP